MTSYGYARVSTDRQELQDQLDRVIAQGADSAFTRGETISGGKAVRPVLRQTLDEVQEGDSLHVTAVDRLGRNAAELYSISEELKTRGVTLVIDGHAYDPNTLAGSVLFSAFAMVAEIERALNRDRTKARLSSMRAQGKPIGPKPALSKRQATEARKAVQEEGISISRVAKIYDCSRLTVKRAIERLQAEDAYATDPTLRREVHQQIAGDNAGIKRLEAAKAAADKSKAAAERDKQVLA